MAITDYYLCDVCGDKTFYDAELDYGDTWGSNYQPMPRGVGDMKVICKQCTETHQVVVRPLDTAMPVAPGGDR